MTATSSSKNTDKPDLLQAAGGWVERRVGHFVGSECDGLAVGEHIQRLLPDGEGTVTSGIDGKEVDAIASFDAGQLPARSAVRRVEGSVGSTTDEREVREVTELVEPYSHY